ncbi:adenosylcobinamide-GDP ribazoletransferase [Candidatus Synechococcus spongiarum]|uniref:adenosylcobinamide-GDP ribazoletransferase n=1 Tax=Candidatus Synechococcus spongiarum TaxID=431041 RepID=UPI000470D9EA|nr:adenosylcobinamide-GDP ribazoletransferase [Candidatus Synechococcus spongiarum]
MPDPRPGHWWNDLAGSWMFYSRLPPLPWVRPSFGRIARFAPLVGGAVALIQGLLWQLVEPLHLPIASGISLLLVAEMGLTGGLHLDGVMDTADGLSAGPAQQKAMADSRVGAMGVTAVAALLLLRFGGWLWLAEADGPMAAVLASVAVWARTAPLLALAWWPPLRQEGSGARHAAQQQNLIWELLPAGLLLACLTLGFGLWVLPGGMASIGVTLLLGRLLGGQSGDSLGATLEWSATACVWLYGLVLVAPTGVV